MLISKFVAAGGTKRLRITEEFAKLLMVSAVAVPDTALVTAYLERSGKNVEIINRLPFKELTAMSAVINNTSMVQPISSYKTISLFQNGNYKGNESDAVIIEFEGLDPVVNYELYGLQDIDNANGVYYYEEKAVLVGEKSKIFDLKGVERMTLGNVALLETMNFYYRDMNGSLIERKFTPEELKYSTHEQFDMNPYQILDGTVETFLLPLVLCVDGLESVKLTMLNDLTEPYKIYLQSKYDLVSNSSNAPQLQSARKEVANVSPGINNVIGTIGSSKVVGNLSDMRRKFVK